MADEHNHIQGQAARLTEPTDTLPEAVRARVSDPTFALALRGYDRSAVDVYVQRVIGIVSELEASRSPREAVRQALERVGEETTDILSRAHDTAEEITGKARAEAEELRARTEADADELRSRTKAETDELRKRTEAETTKLSTGARKEAEELRSRAQADAEALETGSTTAAEELLERAKAETDELRTRTEAEAEALSTQSREEAAARLKKAREEAEALDTSSREQAEQMLENAKRNAHASVAGIEQRLAELDGEVDAVWSERQRLIGDIQQLSRDLRGLAREAEVRFPAESPPVPYESSTEETVEMSNELPDAVHGRS